MYTLCPHCDSVHPLTAEQLAADQGKVRCARCETTFNALEQLFDDYPDKQRKPSAAAADETPEVGRKPSPAIPAGSLEPPVQERKSRWPWAVAVSLLLIATTMNLVWTFRDQVPKNGALAQLLDSAGVPGFAPPPPYRDPARIHLLTRDIHDHPSRDGVLVLSATFINLAEQAQPYPEIAIVLKNSDNQPLAARRFQPRDYLLRPPGDNALLDPNEQVPILLEFADPGERATGYDISFH